MKVQKYPHFSTIIFKTLLHPTAKKFLWGYYSPTRTRTVLNLTWCDYNGLVASLPQEKTMGARLMIRLAALIIAMYRSLVAAGEKKEMAHTLAAELAWQVYQKAGRLPWLIAGIRTRDHHNRLRLATQLFRHFPFSSPSYRWQDVYTEPNVVAFNCQRCPAANFFASHDLSQLCVETFCNLDFPLAGQWGAILERTGCIAGGANHCDFRWRVAAPQNTTK